MCLVFDLSRVDVLYSLRAVGSTILDGCFFNKRVASVLHYRHCVHGPISIAIDFFNNHRTLWIVLWPATTKRRARLLPA